MRRSTLVGAVALLTAGCGASAPETHDAVQHGRTLFESRGLSPSGINLFTCATCHDTLTTDPDRLRPGARLAGVTLRPSYWGGQENDLLLALNACRAEFMLASVPLSADDPSAEDLYAYLASLEPGDTAAAPFTVVREIVNVPRGDAARGTDTFGRACGQCHGAIHNGAGGLGPPVPRLPEDTLLAHPAPTYSARVQRLIFIEKTRHGGFLGYGGEMPPFSTEVLPDADLSDVLEALGVLGE